MKLYAYRVCARGTRRVYRNHCHCVIVSPFLCMCLCSFIPRCKGTKFLGEMQVFSNLFCCPFLPIELCVNSKRIMRANSSNSACKLFGCRLNSKLRLTKRICTIWRNESATTIHKENSEIAGGIKKNDDSPLSYMLLHLLVNEMFLHLPRRIGQFFSQNTMI